MAFVSQPLLFRTRCHKLCHNGHDAATRNRRRARARRAAGTSMAWKPAGLLREAVEMKNIEVEMLENTLKERPDHPINLKRSFFAQETDHSLSKALRRSDGTLAIVLGVKRFQPSPPGQSAVQVAALEDMGREIRAFDVHGVDAALVCAEPLSYGVELRDLSDIARRLMTSNVDRGMPLVCRDLIVDPVQMAEAAVLGARAVCVVAAAALDNLDELLNAGTAMGLETVVECHSQLELEFAMECGATVVYLNNWDRTRNVRVDGTAERLAEQVPPWVIALGGGGLQTASDCWRLMDAGCNGVVLGRTLLQTPRASSLVREIRSQKRITGDIFSGDFGVPFSEGYRPDED